MQSAGEPALLRPLSLGEIFDRAVTLYVRNFVPFVLIALVIVVPMAILQYFAGMRDGATFVQLMAQIQHPHKGPLPAATAADTGLAFGMIAAAIVLGAFAVVAIAAAIGEIYRGRRAEWNACYGYALRRTGAILLTLLCEMSVIVLVVFAGAFVMGGIFVAAFLLVQSSPALGIAAFVAAALFALLWVAALLLCYLAFAFAFNALAIEGAPVGAAISRGFSRIFNRSELLRAVLICLALMAIYLGLSVVSLSVAAVFESLHLHLLNVVVSALISLVSTSFLGILLAVYYFDVRVRREGLDMQTQIEGLQPLASAP